MMSGTRSKLLASACGTSRSRLAELRLNLAVYRLQSICGYAGRMTAPDPAGSSLDKSAHFWLSELRDTHAKLLVAIEELARLTVGPPPQKHLLVNTRWRLSSASLARRLLWGRIQAFLSRHPDQDFEDDLRLLQQRDIELLRASTQHVTRWTTDAVLADWQGYCRASDEMRQKMIDAIMREKQLLYSVLSNLTRSSL